MTAAAMSDVAPVDIGTDWISHRELSVGTERELTDCHGTLRAARRTAVGKNTSVIEIECSNPACLFETTTDDLSFRRAQERRQGMSDDEEIWYRR